MFTALLERSFAATLSVLRKKISMLAIVITPERVATRDLSCMKGPWNRRNQGAARRTGRRDLARKSMEKAVSQLDPFTIRTH